MRNGFSRLLARFVASSFPRLLARFIASVQKGVNTSGSKLRPSGVVNHIQGRPCGAPHTVKFVTWERGPELFHVRFHVPPPCHYQPPYFILTRGLGCSVDESLGLKTGECEIAYNYTFGELIGWRNILLKSNIARS